MNAEPHDSRIARGWLLLQQRRYAEAEAQLVLALQQDPRSVTALYALSLSQLNQDGKHSQALVSVERALAVDPNDADCHAARAYILGQHRRPADAVAAADAAVALDPSSVYAWNAKAFAHSLRSEWRHVEAASRRALEVDPDNVAAANQLAQALRLQNRMDETSEHLAALLARDPENGDTHANAGWAALQRGERAKAETHFLEALRLEPESDFARRGLVEAFKGRSPLYRAYLAYGFFMARFQRSARWGILVGLLVVARLSDRLFAGRLAWLGALVAIAYAVFALWVHIARGIGSLMLLADRKARHALNRGERREGLFVGGSLLCGILFGVGGAVAGRPLLMAPAVTCGLAALPFAHTFTNDSRVGRRLFGGIGALALLAGLGVVLAVPVGGAAREIADAAFLAAVILCVLSTWLSNIECLNQ